MADRQLLYERAFVVVGALLINLSIGQAYAFSVFNIPLTRVLGIARQSPDDWTLTQIGWIFTLAYVFLGISAAASGKWQQRVGPRNSAVTAAIFWAGGLFLSAVGVWLHQLWLIYIGYGVIGGIGLGVGFTAPISTLIAWFPERKGMATGVAIMGFGGGAILAAPISESIMARFRTTESSGVAETFTVLGIVYLLAMLNGARMLKLPASRSDTGESETRARAGEGMSVDAAMRQPVFYLLWCLVFLNVTAGLGVLGQASAMVQEMFDGFSASAAAGFVALLSLFNMLGRFLWATLSDFIGRRVVFGVFFSLGPVLYAMVPLTGAGGLLVGFVTCFALILSMYGGGFATLPAYVADVFGPRDVGAIHGRLLTALSAAGIAGPSLVNYVRQYQLVHGTPGERTYDLPLFLMAGLLVVGFIINFYVRPVYPRAESQPLELD